MGKSHLSGGISRYNRIRHFNNTVGNSSSTTVNCGSKSYTISTNEYSLLKTVCLHVPLESDQACVCNALYYGNLI